MKQPKQKFRMRFFKLLSNEEMKTEPTEKIRSKTQKKQFTKLQNEFRKYWKNIFKSKEELNIFHVQKFKRQLTELENI